MRKRGALCSVHTGRTGRQFPFLYKSDCKTLVRRPPGIEDAGVDWHRSPIGRCVCACEREVCLGCVRSWLLFCVWLCA